MQNPMLASMPRDLLLAHAEISEAFRDISMGFLMPDGEGKKARLGSCLIGIERALQRTRAAVARMDSSATSVVGQAPEPFDTRESVEFFIEHAARGMTAQAYLEWLKGPEVAMLRRLINRLEPLSVGKS